MSVRERNSERECTRASRRTDSSEIQRLCSPAASVPPPLLACNISQISLAVGEYLYAHSLRSIALRAHALLVASESLQITVKVVALILRAKPADGHFSYGYGRIPVLVEYAGAVLQALVTCSLSLEALLRLKHHSALFQGLQRTSAQATILTHDVAAPFAVFALTHVALVCLVARHEQGSQSGRVNNIPTSALHAEYKESLLRGRGGVLWLRSRAFFGLSRNNLLLGVSLLASVTLVVGGVVMHWSTVSAMDAAVCLVLCLLVTPSLMFKVVSSAPILVQRAPPGPRAAFDKGSREVATLEGVVECRKERFWEHSPGVFVGTISVRVRQAVDDREMLARIRRRFAGVCTHLTVQLEHEVEPLLGGKPYSHQMQLLRSPKPL